jgi:hypothetical protein
MTPREFARVGVDGLLEAAGMALGSICLIGWGIYLAVKRPPMGGK